MVDMRIFPRKREYYQRRLAGLDQERQSFIAHYKEITDFLNPRKGRYFLEDRNRGGKRHNNIINNRALQSLRVAAAGLMANMTSKARPWFKLETPDPAMMEFQPISLWLADVEQRMRTVFNASNLYHMLSPFYMELLGFGTGVISHVDDFESVARFYTHTVGSYWIAQNPRYQVDTLYREFMMTVAQMVRQFGIENVSSQVKRQYDEGNYELWYPVVHVTEPNPDYDPNREMSRYKLFRSAHYEKGIDDDPNQDKMLRESGFDEFPHYVARWETTAEDIYGTSCPGMIALGDIKQLQQEEKRKAQGIDKMVNPPLKGPGSLRNVPVSSLPGGLTVFDGELQNTKLEPIYLVQPRVNELMLDIEKIEKRLQETFFVDLFFAISNMEGIQPRNEMEIIARNQEKLLMLGPVVERIEQDLLAPLIDRTFNQMVRANILPPPPEELSGQPLTVQYISTLSMAQRVVGTAAIERSAAFIGGLAGATGDLSVWDKFNADQAIDEYARAVGTSPRVIRADDEVAQIRQQRLAQQQQAQQMEMAQQGAQAASAGAQAAKTISEIELAQ